MLAGLGVVWEESQKCYITGIDWFIEDVNQHSSTLICM